jgi:thymidine phosphorylase
MSTQPIPEVQRLSLKRLGIDTYQEPVAYMSRECPVARAEGFESQSRVLIQADHTKIIATLHLVVSDLVAPNELALSESAWTRLHAEDGMSASVRHPRSLDSLGAIRSKIFGNPLSYRQFCEIITDVVDGRFRDIHIAAFLTSCATAGLSVDETAALTRAMVDVGEVLDWERERIFDKHCIGGLPGNRTTPLVVAIVTAFGLPMPKTSSRAITSPAGTADTMATITNVELSLALRSARSCGLRAGVLPGAGRCS